MAATRYENDSSANSGERLNEDRGLVFPVFDSLPASAGLTNTEAFRLSLKHALAMLPSMLAAREAATISETTERFSLH